MLTKPLKIKFTKDKRPVKLVVMPPDYKSEQLLRVAYAKAYRQAIQQGVATRPSMLDLMRKEGVWGTEQEEELTQLTIHAALLEAALDEQDDVKKQKELVLELSKVRNQIYELVAIKMMPLEHTAEQIAEDVKLDVYIALCTKDTNGVVYFKSHEDFIERRHDADADKVFKAVVEELSKGNIEMLRQLPEHEWLIKNSYMDKDGNFLDAKMEEEFAEAQESVDEVIEETIKGN